LQSLLKSRRCSLLTLSPHTAAWSFRRLYERIMMRLGM
jgi:hypothetical protein